MTNNQQTKEEYIDDLLEKLPDRVASKIKNVHVRSLISEAIDWERGRKQTKKCGNAGDNVKLTYKGGCGEEVYIRTAYRCTGCGGWFHKDCILEHFKKEKEHDWGRQQERQRLLDIVEELENGLGFRSDIHPDNKPAYEEALTDIKNRLHRGSYKKENEIPDKVSDCCGAGLYEPDAFLRCESCGNACEAVEKSQFPETDDLKEGMQNTKKILSRNDKPDRIKLLTPATKLLRMGAEKHSKDKVILDNRRQINELSEALNWLLEQHK